MINFRFRTGIFCILGSIGCGKSTYAAAIAQWAFKHKIACYTNFDVVNARRFYDYELGHFASYLPDGTPQPFILIIDESGISFNGRKWEKGLMSDTKRVEFLKTCRHYHCMIIWISQSNDADKTFRTLTSEYWYLRRRAFGLTVVIPYFAKLLPDNVSHTWETSFVEGTKLERTYFFRRKYFKFFDSFERKPLPSLDCYRAFKKEDGDD